LTIDPASSVRRANGAVLTSLDLNGCKAAGPPVLGRMAPDRARNIIATIQADARDGRTTPMVHWPIIFLRPCRDGGRPMVDAPAGRDRACHGALPDAARPPFRRPRERSGRGSRLA
jgi:hypothetical protein